MAATASNVLEVNGQLKLIDLDACVNYEDGDVMGTKYSSGYIPPETIVLSRSESEDREAVIRCSEVLADTSFDIWALGCVFYDLCTGSTLFHLSVDDQITRQQDLQTLYNFSDIEKEGRLKVITDILARNLLAMLLSKDPSKRPSASKVLEHPFLIGASRTLRREEAVWDVFLSCRGDTDRDIAERIYNALCDKRLRVWWDVKCMVPTSDDDGRGSHDDDHDDHDCDHDHKRCSALIASAHFVQILSRKSIKHEMDHKMNFEIIEPSAEYDHFLFESRLALELKQRGVIKGIFPVMVGDYDSQSNKYSNYFDTGCHPMINGNVVVTAIENQLRRLLDQQGLGSAFESSKTVKTILTDIVSNQGGFVEGEVHGAIATIADAIVQMAGPPSLRRISQNLSAATSLVRMLSQAFSSRTHSVQSVVSDSSFIDVNIQNLEMEKMKLIGLVDKITEANNILMNKINAYEASPSSSSLPLPALLIP